MKRTCATGIVLALATAFLAIVAPSTASARDRDCSDFATQRAAQIYYIDHGGPQSDPDGLDRDDDGVACDSNPCPCYHGSHVPSSTAATHHPVRSFDTVRTRIQMAVSARGRIAHERLTMAVTIRPRLARPVRIQRLHAGRWTTVVRGHTTRAGRLRVTRPSATFTSSYRAVVSRARVHRTVYTAAISRAKRVARQIQRVTLALPTTVRQKTAVTAVVTAAPVRGGRSVLLQRYDGSSWVRYGNLKRESAGGAASFTIGTAAVGDLRLRAVVRAGNGARVATSRASVLTVTDGIAPAPPTGLTATAGDGEVSLSWDASPATDLARYRVYVTSTTPAGLVQADVQPGTATHATVTNLTNGTRYYFTVTATDEAGNQSLMSASADATPMDTVPPAAPTNLSGAPQVEAAALTWDAVSAPDLAHYRVYIATTPGVWSLADQQPEGTSTTDTVTGLANGTTYYFAVTAVDSSGLESPKSSAVSVTPTPCPPLATGGARPATPRVPSC